MVHKTEPASTPQGKLAAPRAEAHSVDEASVRREARVPGSILPEPARKQWLLADWRGLIEAREQNLATQAERAKLSALSAVAKLQLGDSNAARVHARHAIDSGCGRRLLAQLLLAGAHHTLARASFVARRERQSETHFERAASAGAESTPEGQRFALLQSDRVRADLSRAVAAKTAERKQGIGPFVRAPAWIVELADQCLAASDLHDSVDLALQTLLVSADERAHLLMQLSAGFAAKGDSHTAVHFLQHARILLPDAHPALRNEVARLLIAAGSVDTAVDVVIEGALPAVLSQPGDRPLVDAVQAAYRRMRSSTQARNEHGHHLLMAHLDKHLTTLRAAAKGRRLTLIEVGTTREDVPGQGSTRKLAEFCLRADLHFVTVDMDPHNSRMAMQTFERLGASFEAVTMKGEDYLREVEAPVDLVFLDAYDFDHGKHSELRQSRYERFLGSRIDEQACHQMHLDCAQSLAEKLSPSGLICIDDTWLDQGRWTAKGTLAMPYLLANGFEVVEARNRAALLRRSSAPMQSTSA